VPTVSCEISACTALRPVYRLLVVKDRPANFAAAATLCVSLPWMLLNTMFIRLSNTVFKFV
jgi:hypothetical protein